MNRLLSRKTFLRRTILGASGLFFLSPDLKPAALTNDPPLDAKLVKEFVAVSHRDLSSVKGLLAENPALLHATWDWGGGDFETGIGAASHVGNREVAEFLLSRGARMNLFTAAMLGNLDVVKSIIEQFPGQLETKGPHGLSLMHHAQKGGEEAQAIVDYLESKGISR